jgi:formylglycine-generating enzyme required for sulfatase activity
LLGLLAVCSLQSLFLPQTLAVPAIVKLLEGLGLNVLAGYLGEALKDVWRRTGRPEVPRAEVSKAIRRIARDKEDAATEIAQLARDSGALQATLETINAHITGSEALLQGLRRDVERHTAVLGVLQIELREVKQGVWEVFRVAKEVRQDTRAIREDTAAMRPQINEIHEQVTADANQRRAQKQMLLRDYLSTLSQDCNRLSLADYDSSDPNKLAIDLDSVYVRLEVARTVDQEGRQRAIGREPRHLTALEALAEQPRLVLLGVPGSGKSTFVNFLARCLALARLEDQPRWLERLGAEWPHGPLVPIQITLRKFAAWVAEQNPPIDHGDAGLPWRFLAATQGDGLAACLRRLAHDGRALLLFDGLDEVAADERDWPLVPVRESIAALARGLAPGSRALVTCRVLDYQWQPRRLADWPDDTIAPLSEPLQEQFIHNWYAALERLRRPLLDTAAALKERLTRAVRERRELRRLAGNPLLLTMMALVQSYKGRLPEERVRLYAECIEFLLHRWRARPEERSLRDRLDLPQWSETNLYELLELLGHATHLRETNPDDERGADLPYKLLIDIAQSYFEAYGRRSYGRAEQFADYISQASNGILQVDKQLRSKDITYRFPHRTFQEYLAGRALTNDGLRLSDEQPDAERDLITRALRYVDAGPQWREALLLAASQHALNGRSREVVDLVQELQADARAAKLTVAQARRIMLAGEMLLEVGRERIARLGERRAAIWEQTRDNLLPLLPYPPSTAMPPLAPVERARAALVLARLGDPRPGVCTLEPDWCGPFPAGKYPIADGKATLRLEEFRIARYPVTVWQFRQFWEDPQGYENERLWPPLGWQWKQRKPVTRQPYRWGDPEWTADNQPVAGISWYEAVAFCNWLTRRGHAERWLKPDEVIRLPSEAEWEVAAMWDARAQQMRAWQPPKGEIWQNVEEAGIGRTAPVGLFPQGASPCGALDMAGNVWEWCGSAYDDYPAQAHRLCDDFPPGEFGPALRGGSYYLQNASSGWGARNWYNPYTLLGLRGCRVCVCSARDSR